MALIDEYKQAIQDVLDGRAKEAPRPSELPWSEDKAATMWAAAAAELIAEDNAGGGGGGSGLPDTPGSNGSYALMNTVASGTGTVSWVKPLVVTANDGMSSTFKEIRDAFVSGRHVYAIQDMMGSLYSSIVGLYADGDNEVFRVVICSPTGSLQKFKATSLNGYPTYEA